MCTVERTDEEHDEDDEIESELKARLVVGAAAAVLDALEYLAPACAQRSQWRADANSERMTSASASASQRGRGVSGAGEHARAFGAELEQRHKAIEHIVKVGRPHHPHVLCHVLQQPQVHLCSTESQLDGYDKQSH